MIRAFKIPSLFEVRFVNRAGGCERPHTHAAIIISAVTGGQIQLQVGEEEICLRPGAVAAVGPNVLHCVRSFSSDFSGLYVLEVSELPLDSDEGDDAAALKVFGHRFLRDHRCCKDFVTLCDRLLGAGEDAAKIDSYVDWINLQFAKRFDEESDPCLRSVKHCQLAASIKQMLDDENAATAPYAQIAHLCGYSAEHCNRVFKQVYQLSMQAYFLNHKAVMAKELLDSGTPLAEIALRCGFYDQSHFIRVFKGLYQVSPLKYRQAIYESRHSHTRKNSQKDISSLR